MKDNDLQIMMTSNRSSMRALLFAALLISVAQQAQADAQAGKTIFNQCVGCHAVGQGALHRFGPQLNGLMARGVASADGYSYSDALKAKASEGLSWNESTLDAYLAAPGEYVPGTKMLYPGLTSSEQRSHVIAYLETINSDGSIDGVEQAAALEVAENSIAPQRTLASEVPIPEHGILHLGRPALDEEVQAWDIDIRPDGAGLPVGAGSVETGGEIYDAQCASCHGVFGEGEGRWPMLAGGEDTLTDERPEKTVGSYWPYLSTVYDYIRRAMPFGNARSLSDDDVYALTAYLLYLNDLVDESFELSDQNFNSIVMPNEANFIADNRADETWFEAVVEPCMSNCIEGEAVVSQRARVLDVTPDAQNDEDGGGLD